MTPQQNSMTFAAVLAEELSRLGIVHCCMVPGARSSALSIAITAHPQLQSHVFADERSAAFSALGMAKLYPSQCKVAVLTTSGTAVANLFPAIIEASESEVSLLVLTADRPPELRASRANQCIAQPNIFGGYVRQCIDFPVPEVTTWHHSLSQLDYLVFRSQYPTPGPVHANLMFREPLGIELDIQISALPERLQAWSASNVPFTIIDHCDTISDHFLDIIQKTTRGCVVVGSLPHDQQAHVLAFIQSLGWPVILDAASGLRYHNIRNTILFHDGILRDLAPKLQLETVVRIGHVFSSKWIDRCLLAHAQNRIAVDWSTVNPDPESICNYICVTKNIRKIKFHETHISTDFTQQISKHNSLVASILSASSSIEMSLMSELSPLVPANGILFIGNSMPIRDFSNVSLDNRPDVSVFCNRGASGIDGLISTAAGLAVTSQRHCTLVLGDLSAIHDLSSLLYLKELPIHLRIIIVNNSGGQIFRQLPLFESRYFSPNFDAAHQTDFSQIIQAMTIESHRVDDIESLKTIELSKAPSIQCIELCVDKEKELEARQDTVRKIQSAIAPIWEA